jgi:purine-binding chemotaxis protein CheW
MSQVLEGSEKVSARYLSFCLGNEEFAIPLLSVKEVIAVPEITPIPSSPIHFLGIMNLRGQVISIIDLRQKLGIQAKNSTETAVIICDLGNLCLGVVVDSINSVLAPKCEDISPKPELQSSKNSDYITGVFRKENRLVIFLDIVKTLSPEDHRAASPAQLKKTA